MRKSIPLLAAAALVLGACGTASETGAGSVTPSTAVSSNPSGGTTTASPGTQPDTTTAPEDPTVYGPTALVSFQESCTIADDGHATWTTDPDGTVHVRDGWFSCVVTSNDPRAAGTSRYTWNADRWGEEEDKGSMVQWGTIRLRNAGGTWVGRWDGIYTSDTGDLAFYLLSGTGDYAGLSYYRWTYKTFGTSWPGEGLITPNVRR